MTEAETAPFNGDFGSWMRWTILRRYDSRWSSRAVCPIFEGPMEIRFSCFDSPLGTIRLGSNGKALTEVCFLQNDSERADDETDAVLTEARKQLEGYFKGERRDFNIDLEPKGTDFQRRVWAELQRIPYGSTISYRELAVRLGDPKCIRAAAAANGRNPIGIFIPCHRVIGSDGRLTGYAGGLWRKSELLRLEGFQGPSGSLFG